MRAGSEQDLVERVRRQLALPMSERINFFRVRYPWGGSSL
jgi:hypothetical protein